MHGFEYIVWRIFFFLRFMHDTTILFKKINKTRIINKFDVNHI